MPGRRYWTWRVSLSTEAGQTLIKTIKTFWSPSMDTTRAYVANCAAAMEAARLKQIVFPTADPELVS